MDHCGEEKARIRFIVAPDFHKLRVENNMPTPPDYETTRTVYFYLLDHTELDGRVPVPLRRIAKDMGRAWSTIRWHILHLEESGLVFRRPESNHMKRTIYIRDMEMKDPEKVFQNISASPRIPWHKRTGVPKEVAEMQGTQDDGAGRTRNVSLSLMFSQMSPEFREGVIRRALTQRDRVSGEGRDALNRAIGKHIVVDGFRNAGLAPAAIVTGSVAEKVGDAEDLAGGVLRVWYESQDELRETVTPHLEGYGLAVTELDYSKGQIRAGLKNYPLADAVASFMADHPETDENEVTLAMELMTGTFLGMRRSSEPGAGQVSSILEAALDALQSLPRDAEEWNHLIPGFSGMVANIIEAKKAAPEQSISLDNLFAEICEQYGELLEFFELDARHWFATNLSGGSVRTFRVLEDLWGERRWFPPGDWPGSEFQDVYDLAVELQDLLSQYAPIHERAKVASKEMIRAEERMELLPAILEVGESLAGMMSSGNGGPIREIPTSKRSSDLVPDAEGSPLAGSGD